MFSTKLLRWFRKAKRPLPWRTEPRDPYRTWVSEVMLQQTRVDVVIPYYQRFLKRFPTLQSLAAAPLDDVLALWSGLGYYSRARNMHEAAKRAAPALPTTAAELRELPGFGPYTAAAVASLAHNEDVPLVDGNVARVLARVFRLRGDARARSWKLAEELLPRGQAGEFNEALMELGATVCTPRAPRCTRCPLGTLCRGRDTPERFPEPKKSPARPLLEWQVVALRRNDGAVLLARRPADALFAGMWDLPMSDPGVKVPKWPGVRLQGKLERRGVVEQTLTHREVRVTVSAGRATGIPKNDALRWVAPENLHQLGLSSLARKTLRKAGVAC
jgi:A/G-specific adenine glycosylase